MTLEEIKQGNAAEQRVKRLKDNAKAAKDKATQLTTQANVSADQLKMQKSREKLSQLRAPAIGPTIKPHA